MTTFHVVKRHKRLHIDRLEDGTPVYTPPDFVQIPNRQPLLDLAEHFTKQQARDIEAIAAFETRWKKKSLRSTSENCRVQWK